MGLFGSKLWSKENKARYKRELREENQTIRLLKRSKDDEFIRQCAQEHSSLRVRLAAVARIKDAHMLGEIMLKEPPDEVRNMAMLKLGADELFSVALKTENARALCAYLKRFVVMGRGDLQEPLLRALPQMAGDLVDCINDPEMLLRLFRDGIARDKISHHMYYYFRQRMIPEMHLYESREPTAVFAAIQNATDQMALAQRLCRAVFQGDMEDKVGSAILERLTEPEALRYAALHLDNPNAVRCLDKLGAACMEDAAFRKAALGAPNRDVVCRALDVLDDKQRYAVVAVRGRMNDQYRVEALHRMRDRALIKELAHACDDFDLRHKAAVATGDGTLMRQAIETCKRDDSRLAVLLESVFDAGSLERVAADMPDPPRIGICIDRMRELGAHDAATRTEGAYMRSLENDREGWMKIYLAYMSQPREKLSQIRFAGSVTKALTDKLEALLKEGNADAGKALIRLYMARDLNPAIKGRAMAQQHRIQQQHSDETRSSMECGVNSVHDDEITGETIMPL